MNMKQLTIFKSQWKTGTLQIAGHGLKGVSRASLKDFCEDRVEAVWSPITRTWTGVQVILKTLPDE